MNENNHDLDKDYTTGSLYLGVGLSLLSIITLTLFYIKEYMYLGFAVTGVLVYVCVAMVGLIFCIVGVSKKMPKRRYLYDKNTSKKYFDEQDIMLIYKSQSNGFWLLVLLLVVGYAIKMPGGSIPLLWVQSAIFAGFAVKNLCYYWFTKDAYNEE